MPPGIQQFARPFAEPVHILQNMHWRQFILEHWGKSIWTTRTTIWCRRILLRCTIITWQKEYIKYQKGGDQPYIKYRISTQLIVPGFYCIAPYERKPQTESTKPIVKREPVLIWSMEAAFDTSSIRCKVHRRQGILKSSTNADTGLILGLGTPHLGSCFLPLRLKFFLNPIELFALIFVPPEFQMCLGASLFHGKKFPYVKKQRL